MLAAARANNLSLFGDIDQGRDDTYASRMSVSLRQHTFTETGDDFDPDINSAGQLIAFASTRHHNQPDLYVKSVDGIAVTQLTSDPASDIQPSFSPDDTRVAFASNRGGSWDIWMVDLEGGQPVQVTSGLADELHPSWSPDGRKLAYCSLPPTGGQWEIWVTDATAGSTKKRIGYGLFPEWSPTADTLVFQRARERGGHLFSIWTLTLVDGEPRYPTELAAGAREAMILPTWSPDGTRIAFTSTTTLDSGGITARASDVWLIDADGRGKVRLTDGQAPSHAPTFCPDGRVYFATKRTGNENIWSVLPAGRTVTTNQEDVTREVISRDAPPRSNRPQTTVRTTSVREGT
jgi:Tol biopolymer transport system component